VKWLQTKISMGITKSTIMAIVTLLLLPAAGWAQRSLGVKGSPAGKRDQKRLSATQIFERSAPRVVLLKTHDEKGIMVGQASGVLLSPDGYVATNAHVVVDCSTLAASVSKSRSGDAQFAGLRLMYYDSESDVAILKMDAENLPFFELSAVLAPRVGERVYAIGSPRGLENTISEGIVSGVREIGTLEYLQHSAPISPGSSGGALINERGILIGLNTFLLERSQNLNFAIPVSVVRAALATARVNPIALPFPKSKVVQAASSSAPNCYVAFFEHNYIGAIAIANRIVTEGNPTTKEYGVIGMSYFELGKIAEAETYLRQTLMLGTSDDPFKQTARYYLVRIGAKKMEEAASAENRVSLAEITRSFLNSKERTLLKGDDDKSAREWVQKILLDLKDISGDWVDGQGELYFMLVKNSYRLEDKGNGVFSISLLPRDQGDSYNKVRVLYTLFGRLSRTVTGKFIGTVSLGVLASDGGTATGATQDARLELALSDDSSQLSGTVEYLNVEGSGPLYDVWRNSSRPRTVRLALVRK
jgi:S1-C subfamily serine protease